MQQKTSFLSNFSLFFLEKFRVTLLVIIGVILLGYISYTYLINKEGFPPANVPVVIVNGVYQVNDKEKIDRDATNKIEGIVREVDIVDQVRSTTSDNTFTVVVDLNAGTDLKEGLEVIEKEIDSKFTFPENLDLNVFTINAGKYYGEYDIVVNIYADTNDTKQLQAKAEELREEFSDLNGLVRAEVIPVINTRNDVATGESIEVETAYNKIGIDQNSDDLKFYNAISLGLVKRDSDSVLEFSGKVDEKIKEIDDASAFDGFSITPALDFAPSLQTQLSSLEENFFGAMITLALIVLILINLRASLVVLIFIPLIISASIVTLYISGISLNIISLFSLILVLGLFVDNVVVIVEAVDQYKLKGQGQKESLINAIKDVGPAYIVGTLTNILVFVPMLFISGVLGEFIRLIPLTVIISASLSVILTLTIVAALSAFLIKPRAKSHKLFSLKNLPNIGGDLANKLGEKIGKFVRFYLGKKFLSLLLFLVSLAAIVGGAMFAQRLEFNIFPQQSDTEEIQAELVFPEGTTLAQSKELSRQFDEKLKQFDNVIERVIYQDANARGATIAIELTKMDAREETSQSIKDRIQTEVDKINGARITVDVISAGPPSDPFPFRIQVFDQDTADLDSATKEIRDYLQKQEITNQQGKVVKLKDIEINNLNNIAKIDGRRYASIQASFENNKDADTNIIQTLQQRVVDEFNQEKLNSLGITSKDPIGTDLGFQSDNLESFESTIVAFFVALLVMYIVLVIQYNSFTLPLLIFSAIPFSFPGLFPGLYYTGNPLSFFVSLGIIALAGIVVNNTIVLVDYANTYLEEGGSIREAISRAIAMRFRPILVSSLTTILGLLPLGLSDPFWQGLSFTIVFGFASSTIFVILVFPIYYTAFQVVRRWTSTKAKMVFGRFN